jgi:chromosome partitioning protein
MYVLAFVNQKGGVGKTTSAVTLAHGLAREGLRVLLVDLDPQGNVADVLGVEKDDGLYRLLVSKTSAITHGVRPRLDAILGNHATMRAKQILAGQPFSEMVLSEVLADVAAPYDAVLLDVAPAVDLLQIAALVACDGFIVPVALDHLAVVGAVDALVSAKTLDTHGYSARVLGILPTMWERTTNEGHTMMKALAERFGGLVWGPIPMDVRAREAPRYGKTLWEYAPDTRAIVGVKIGQELLGGYAATLARVQAIIQEDA